jgi:glycosyltransferase involved in cell wall biosynthesis
MRILWLTWKDRQNPAAGGAETVNEELAKRLVVDGHEVIFLVAGFNGASAEEARDGYKIVRVGSRWSIYVKAREYYRKNLVGWPDLVIDEVNTIPFLAKTYVKERNILFVHQLCREIWFFEMFFPLNLIGYLLEPLYLRLLSDRRVITVSESTKKDLTRFGFKPENIAIISEGIDIEPLAELGSVEKFDRPTLLAHGTIRPMKRTDHLIRAFELAREKIPDLQLIVSGAAEGRYGKKVLKMISKSKYRDDIEYAGKVSDERKAELMQKSHLLCVASVKEGWCLVVTEAASQGTPAVVYDVDGLRDAVGGGQAGSVCAANTPQSMAEKIVIVLGDEARYAELRRRAWESSKRVNFEACYGELSAVIANHYG